MLRMKNLLQTSPEHPEAIRVALSLGSHSPLKAGAWRTGTGQTFFFLQKKRDLILSVSCCRKIWGLIPKLFWNKIGIDLKFFCVSILSVFYLVLGCFKGDLPEKIVAGKLFWSHFLVSGVFKWSLGWKPDKCRLAWVVSIWHVKSKKTQSKKNPKSTTATYPKRFIPRHQAISETEI